MAPAPPFANACCCKTPSWQPQQLEVRGCVCMQCAERAYDVHGYRRAPATGSRFRELKGREKSLRALTLCVLLPCSSWSPTNCCARSIVSRFLDLFADLCTQHTSCPTFNIPRCTRCLQHMRLPLAPLAPTMFPPSFLMSVNF